MNISGGTLQASDLQTRACSLPPWKVGLHASTKDASRSIVWRPYQPSSLARYVENLKSNAKHRPSHGKREAPILMSECLGPERFWCERSCRDKERCLQKAVKSAALSDRRAATEGCGRTSLMNAYCHLQPSKSIPYTSAFLNKRTKHQSSFRRKAQSSVHSAIAVTGPDGRIGTFDQVRLV